MEVVQAYLLLSLWTLGPEKTFEQDRTWMMLGMAIRMATDLNLHRKSITSGLDTEEGRARDLEVSTYIASMPRYARYSCVRSSTGNDVGCTVSSWTGPCLRKWASLTP